MASFPHTIRHRSTTKEKRAEDLSPARAYGPYDLVIDLVGGKTLASALSLLATGATCVIVGYSASPEVTMNVSDLIDAGRTTLYGINMYKEFDLRARLVFNTRYLIKIALLFLFSRKVLTIRQKSLDRTSLEGFRKLLPALRLRVPAVPDKGSAYPILLLDRLTPVTRSYFQRVRMVSR